MKPIRLSEHVEFRSSERTKKMLIRTPTFNAMQICLDAGQEIPPHPEDYSVLFYVIGGNGTITTAEGAWDVQADDIVLVGKGEVRGIVAKTRMRVLGIQEPH